MRITYLPTGVVPTWYCAVDGPGGRMSIPSASFTGFAKADDQRAEFRGFVQALTRAIAAAPHARPVAFLRGGGWMRPYFFGGMIVLAVMGALLAIGAIGAALGGKSALWAGVPVLTVLAAGAMSWQLWRADPPAAFDPDALPADVGGG